MKKRLLLCLTPFILLTACSSNHFYNEIVPEPQSVTKVKDQTDYAIYSNITVDKAPGIYEDAIEIKFTNNNPVIDIYYTFDVNYGTGIDSYFKYQGEKIKIRKPRVESLMDYPITTSVDAILAWDNLGKCVSNNYISNIQNPKNYKLFPKQAVLKVKLVHKETQKEVLNRSLTYFIEENGLKYYANMPIVSLTMSYDDMYGPEGFYNAIRDEYKKRCEIEYIDLKYDEYFRVNGQVKLGGNWSTGYPQRTLNLNFNKDELGKKNDPIKAHIFGDRKAIGLDNKELTNFTRLRLHNGGNCFEDYTGCNDALIQEVVKETNVSTSAYRPCITYINGEYWGMYALREHYKQAYFAQNYGVNKDDVAIVEYKGNWNIDDASDETEARQLLDSFVALINSLNFSNQSVYEKFCNQYIDIDSFIDIIIIHHCAANRDFIGNNNNLKMWRTTKIDENNKYADGKWRFCMHDCDFAFREDKNYLSKSQANNFFIFPLFNKLMQNKSFKNALYNRAVELKEDILNYKNINSILEKMINEVYLYKFDHQTRWGAGNNFMNEWQGRIDWCKTMIRDRTNKFVNEISAITK